MSTKKNRTTYYQLETMVEFLGENKELLLNKNWKKNQEKWSELSTILNSMKHGPIKSCKEWKRVLIEWKYNTKRKLRNISDCKRLNNAEEKLIKLLIDEPKENLESIKMPLVQLFETGPKNIQEILIKSEPLEKVMDENLKNKSKVENTKACDDHLNRSNIIIRRNPLKKKKNIRYASLWTKLSRKLDENTKSHMYLAKAINKLADSNNKLAEANNRVAESNNNLTETLKLYIKKSAQID